MFAHAVGSSRPRSVIRRAAALLAAVGMLGLPMRALAACPMLQPGEAAAPMHHATSSVAADEHAGHDMSAMAGGVRDAADAPTDEPLAPATPTHERCPDLAHCAIAAVPTPLVLANAPMMPVVALRVAALRVPLSAARALEPPPPKA